MSEKINIKEWAEDDRPREKFLEKGAESLSNAELLAILVGSGSTRETVVDLCKRIMKSVDNKLYRLGSLSIDELCKNFHGVGKAKAITILAAIELGKRRSEEQAEQIALSSPEAVFNLMAPLLDDLAHEEFWVVYTGHSNRPIRKVRIGKGGLTQTTVDVRLILKEALLCSATRMILCHNHPSGEANPSQQDIALTRQIKTAAQTLEVEVLDHVIVARKSFYSFNDNGLM